ncbi:MAG TPA: hypothetical protein VF556_01920 [Pyrinomonadaceae bacterium]|jgi:hypothetical protein
MTHSLKSLLIILFASFLFVSCGKENARKSKCSLTIEQSPTIGGLRLRMSREEIKALFPDYSLPTDNKVKINNPSNLPDIEVVSLEFENNRVKSFSVAYQDKNWRNLTEFIENMREKLNLQYLADEEEKPDEFETETLKSRMISCRDFAVSIGGFDSVGGSKAGYIVYVHDYASNKYRQSNGTP